MEISGYSASKYESQLEIILKQELKIEDLQQKLVDNGGSYAAMIKNEANVRSKFVALMQTKYPELKGLSEEEVVNFINQVPQILDLQGQLSVELSELGFTSVAELSDALETLEAQLTAAQANLTTATTALTDLQSQLTAATATRDTAAANLASAQATLAHIIANPVFNPSLQQFLIDAENAKITQYTGELDDANGDIDAINNDITIALNDVDNAQDVVDGLNATKERYDAVIAMDTQLKGYLESNVVYALYSSFSDVEKELIEHFTN